MRLQQYDRAVKYLKHAHQVYKDDIEILYGYSLSIFRDYVTFKDRVMSQNQGTSMTGLLTDFSKEIKQHESITKQNVIKGND